MSYPQNRSGQRGGITGLGNLEETHEHQRRRPGPLPQGPWPGYTHHPSLPPRRQSSWITGAPMRDVIIHDDVISRRERAESEPTG